MLLPVTRVSSDTYEWVGCLVHFAPDLFYLMLYGLLVLLWAALHHDTAPSTHTLLTRLFWAMVIAVRAVAPDDPLCCRCDT